MNEVLGAAPCIWQLRELQQAGALPAAEGETAAAAAVQAEERYARCMRAGCRLVVNMTSEGHEGYEECALVRAQSPPYHWSNNYS